MKPFVLWGYKDICGEEIRCILKICSNGDYSYFMWCLKLIFVIFVAVVLCKMSIGVASVTHQRGSGASADSWNFWFLSSLALPQEGCGSWEFVLGSGQVLQNTSCLDVLQCNWGKFKRLRDLVKPPVQWFANEFSKTFHFSAHRKYFCTFLYRLVERKSKVFIESGWTISHFP